MLALMSSDSISSFPLPRSFSLYLHRVSLTLSLFTHPTPTPQSHGKTLLCLPLTAKYTDKIPPIDMKIGFKLFTEV